jgi:serine protease Do
MTSRSHRVFAAVGTSLALAAALPLSGRAQNPDAQSNAATQVVTRSTFRDLAAKASPAVVHIRIRSNIQPRGNARMVLPPGMDLPDDLRAALENMMQRQMGTMTPGDRAALRFSRSGSGVIVSPDGFIVTNNHVIDGIRPEDIVVNLPDGQTFEDIKIIGQDELTDLAVIKVDGKDLPVLPWGDSDAVQVGDHVMAIGNPLEFTGSVSEGIVSAKHRTINKAMIEDLIQTTAMINPGNSGGALIDLDGKLIGINMAIASNTGLWSGLGFAIPSRTARQIADQLIQRGRVGRGYLGIEMTALTLGLASQLGYEQNFGVVIHNVRPGSAAERAGLERYDILARVNGQELKDLPDVHRNIGTRNAGEEVSLEIWRDEDGVIRPRTVTVKLDERPTSEELIQSRRTPQMPGSPVPERNATLGMVLRPERNRAGIVVERVIPDSRADKANIQVGDVILEINRQKATSRSEAEQAIRAQRNDNHLLYLERDGNPMMITIPPAQE